MNTIEVKKGEDLFSMDKGMLYCELFESFGPKILPIFQPYVLKFTASSEECQQRWASEMVFGLIKGIYIIFFYKTDHVTYFLFYGPMFQKTGLECRKQSD